MNFGATAQAIAPFFVTAWKYAPKPAKPEHLTPAKARVEILRSRLSGSLCNHEDCAKGFTKDLFHFPLLLDAVTVTVTAAVTETLPSLNV
jgi:hypothetical protein